MPTTSFLKGSGGFHNASLVVGNNINDGGNTNDPGHGGDRGSVRYICLANNAAGHAHKEVFLSMSEPGNQGWETLATGGESYISRRRKAQ